MRTGSDVKLSPEQLLADYTTRRAVDAQMREALRKLENERARVFWSEVPTSYVLVARAFSVAQGTLNFDSSLQPRRDAVTRLYRQEIRDRGVKQ